MAMLYLFYVNLYYDFLGLTMIILYYDFLLWNSIQYIL